MSERTVLYKTHTINLISYKLAEGGWVPEAWITTPTEDKEHGHPVRDDSIPPLPTRDAANVIAKKLAIEWIDAQVPSAAVDQPTRMTWTRDTPTRPSWYWYRERGMNLDFPMSAWVFNHPPFIYKFHRVLSNDPAPVPRPLGIGGRTHEAISRDGGRDDPYASTSFKDAMHYRPAHLQGDIPQRYRVTRACSHYPQSISEEREVDTSDKPDVELFESREAAPNALEPAE